MVKYAPEEGHDAPPISGAPRVEAEGSWRGPPSRDGTAPRANSGLLAAEPLSGQRDQPAEHAKGGHGATRVDLGHRM